jgi:hypothetical protein
MRSARPHEIAKAVTSHGFCLVLIVRGRADEKRPSALSAPSGALFLRASFSMVRWILRCQTTPLSKLSQDDLICRRVQCTLIYCTCKGSERPNKVVDHAKVSATCPTKGYRSPRISSRRRSRLAALSFYIAFGKGSSRFARFGVANKTAPEIWNAVLAA